MLSRKKYSQRNVSGSLEVNEHLMLTGKEKKELDLREDDPSEKGLLASGVRGVALKTIMPQIKETRGT